MANQEHLDILEQGVDVWNAWRKRHLLIQPILYKAYLRGTDLSGADLSGADLRQAILREADLSRANLYSADLSDADLRQAILRRADLSGTDLGSADLSDADLGSADLQEANLSRANLYSADLFKADLSGADLSGANLYSADLFKADLSGADLSGANLGRATLVGTNLSEATLTECRIYGISAWDVQLDGAEQLNLRIMQYDKPAITVDNLKIAQFIYLLLNNEEIRDIIDTLTTKAVLILGRFTPERKAVLDALREALRQHNYLPILFDVEKPASRDITETISTLAHLARFVIADITDAKSIPQELMTIVPNLPSVAIQPLILASQHEYGMFEHFARFPWVLPVYRYRDEGSLLKSLKEKVITPAEQKAKELEKR